MKESPVQTRSRARSVALCGTILLLAAMLGLGAVPAQEPASSVAQPRSVPPSPEPEALSPSPAVQGEAERKPPEGEDGGQEPAAWTPQSTEPGLGAATAPPSATAASEGGAGGQGSAGQEMAREPIGKPPGVVVPGLEAGGGEGLTGVREPAPSEGSGAAAESWWQSEGASAVAPGAPPSQGVPGAHGSGPGGTVPVSPLLPPSFRAPPPLLMAARQAFWGGDYLVAESRYEELARSYGDDPDPIGELGNLYYLQGKLQPAVQAFSTAVVNLVRRGQGREAARLFEVIRNLDATRAEELQRRLSVGGRSAGPPDSSLGGAMPTAVLPATH